MKHLVRSFQSHQGLRGAHFYDADSCNFLPWSEVIQFVASFPSDKKPDPFTEKLTESLANYNPDTEFLAVQQNGSAVSVEIYSLTQVDG